MVILLVDERKVLGSLWDGSDVIPVGKDICSAVSHIRVNFPGAVASQHGDLFVLYRWCFGRAAPERFCTVLLAQLTRNHGNAGLQETLYFHSVSCCIWLVPHIYISLKRMQRWNSVLTWENENLNFSERLKKKNPTKLFLLCYL